jgi:hypothetical protein
MAAISAASAANVVSNAPTYTPIVPSTLPGSGSNTTTPATVTNISNTFVAQKVDPADVHLAVISATKYGQAVTIPSKSVNTTTLAGIMAASGTTAATPTAMSLSSSLRDR